MNRFAADLKYGFRMFLKYPGLSLLAILALGLGIHLAAGQLLVIRAFLFQGLPLPDADRIVDITRSGAEEEDYEPTFHPDDLALLAKRQLSFVMLGGFYEGTINVSDGKNPLRFHGGFLSWDFLRAIGVEPERGRAFTEADAAPKAPPALMISHDVWQRDFGGDPAVIGRRLLINSEPGTIVGVMPKGVHFPLREDAWLPLRGPVYLADGMPMFLRGFGRLKPGIDAETARADLNAAAGDLAQNAPERWAGRSIEVETFHRGLIKNDDFSVLWFMLLASSFVLVIACANVANLLLARSTARGRELAVRSALGASRYRLIAQMLAESLALCLAGGAIGVLLTAWVADTVNGWFGAAELPYWIRVQVDMRAIGIVLALIGLCACVAGIVPALRASRTDLLELLKESGRTSTGLHLGWFGRTVIGVQVAMAFALLVLAGMMIRSIHSLREVDVPYLPSEILSARFGLFEQEEEPGPARFSFIEQLTAGLERDPRILAAAVTTRARFDPSMVVPVARGDAAPAQAASGESAFVESVSRGYFRTLEATVHRGRDFSSDDVAVEQDVAIVNESFVRLVFPEAEPIGAKVRIEGVEKETEVRTIVGVVRDLQMNGVKGTERAGIYLPIRPSRDRFFTVLARVRGEARVAEPVLRRVIRQLDANLPLYWVQSYEEAMETAIRPFTVVRTVFLVFGASAVLLAGIGIYGVVSFTVNQRTPEIGIRMALGARAATVLGIVVRQGAVQMVVGMLAGGFLVFSMMGLVRRFEVFVTVRDPALFVLVGVILSIVVLAASLLPARRAAHLTPLAAMRHE